MKVLKRLEFPACCGIDILGYWGWSQTNASSMGERDLHEIEDDLKEMDELKHLGLRLVALDQDQQPYVEYLLEKYGYKPLVRDFYHPGHKHNITLYGKVLRPSESPQLKMGSVPFGNVKRINNETPRERTPKPIATKAKTQEDIYSAYIRQVQSSPIRTVSRTTVTTSPARTTRIYW